jgi:hypothetical protein
MQIFVALRPLDDLFFCALCRVRIAAKIASKGAIKKAIEGVCLPSPSDLKEDPVGNRVRPIPRSKGGYGISNANQGNGPLLQTP